MLDAPLWEACVSPDGYSYGRRVATVRMVPTKGRTRYRLKDSRASYDVKASMVLSPSRFNEWQTFWAGGAARGANSFYMRLMFDALVIYNSGEEIYPVTVTQPWTAKMIDGGKWWQVNLDLNVPWSFGYVLTLCDVIYGGPVNNLAPDDIYGGPITALATDIIEPCELVFAA